MAGQTQQNHTPSGEAIRQVGSTDKNTLKFPYSSHSSHTFFGTWSSNQWPASTWRTSPIEMRISIHIASLSQASPVQPCTESAHVSLPLFGPLIGG